MTTRNGAASSGPGTQARAMASVELDEVAATAAPAPPADPPGRLRDRA
ncbi:MAG: hypothetical protein J2P30_13355 [Actinobacteria bacterium]|nr:hypothetical protein [Actinomycetota bacterium]